MIAEILYLKKISQAMSIGWYDVTMINWRLKFLISHFQVLCTFQGLRYLGKVRVSQNDR